MFKPLLILSISSSIFLSGCFNNELSDDEYSDAKAQVSSKLLTKYLDSKFKYFTNSFNNKNMITNSWSDGILSDSLREEVREKCTETLTFSKSSFDRSDSGVLSRDYDYKLKSTVELNQNCHLQ
jgi:hypothetical protein